MGRKKLGNRGLTDVLRIRLTKRDKTKIRKLGGSAWARKAIIKALAKSP